MDRKAKAFLIELIACAVLGLFVFGAVYATGKVTLYVHKIKHETKIKPDKISIESMNF